MAEDIRVKINYILVMSKQAKYIGKSKMFDKAKIQSIRHSKDDGNIYNALADDPTPKLYIRNLRSSSHLLKIDATQSQAQ